MQSWNYKRHKNLACRFVHRFQRKGREKRFSFLTSFLIYYQSLFFVVIGAAKLILVRSTLQVENEKV